MKIFLFKKSSRRTKREQKCFFSCCAMWKQVTWMPGTGFGSWNLYRNFDSIRARKIEFFPICIDHMRLLNSTSFDSCFVRNHFTFDSFDFANNSRTIIWLFSTHLQLRHSVDSAKRKNFQKSKRELIFLFINFCYYFVCHYDDWCLISFSESVNRKILVAVSRSQSTYFRF